MIHKIGILCASEEELNPFLSKIRNSTVSEKALLTIHEGIIAGIPAVLLYCGVCKVNAALAAQLLIDNYQVDGLIVSGTAGGLDESLSVFDCIVGSEIAYHDVAEDILTEYHPWLSSIWFQADFFLLSCAQKAAYKRNQKIHIGRMITGESFITDEMKDKLIEKYHPLSVDMETAAIAHVCYANHIPFLAVRAITDTADENSPVHFENNCSKASEIASELVIAILEEMTQTIKESDSCD